MHVGMIFDTEPAGTTKFAVADPRLLIVLFGLIIVFAFVAHSIVGLMVILLYVLTLHRLARLSLRSLARRTRTIIVFVVLIVGLNAILVKGSPLSPPVSFLSREGLTVGIFYGLRVLTVYYTTIVFLSVASQETIAKGLAALLRPFSRSFAGRAAFHGFLTMGFVPLFADEIDRIRVAQRFRGGGLQRGFARKIIGVRLLFVPLVISAIHRSGQLAMAVDIRGIRSTIVRLLKVPKPAYPDMIFTAVTLALLVGASSIG